MSENYMTQTNVDILLVGGGIMSATLGTMLMQLDPTLKVLMVERLDAVAHESTDGWNNAGTGHAGYCELNYTPQAADGRIQIQRALNINAAFEVSLQFWSALVEQGWLESPETFINATPHDSFVWGEADVAFLRQRHAVLSQHHLFKDMQYSEDPDVIRQWMPLVMQGRDPAQAVAATRIPYGSDVDFGSLTRQMVAALQTQAGFELRTGQVVSKLTRNNSGWQVTLQPRGISKSKKTQRVVNSRFVFLGAGGGALPLLQKSAIPESRGYGGFPVSGQWLVCTNPAVVRQHQAKVYGKAAVGAPPMSVPHLDTRIINGEPALLFGPYAGFTTRFLKQGSMLDLPGSVKRSNLKQMVVAGKDNMDLTRYLVSEVFQRQKTRVATLRQFYPQADAADWTLMKAGQRVQIIKHCDNKGGKLEFGTELVTSNDGSLAALLGASPGASTAVDAMLQLLERCFASSMPAWQSRLDAMIPARSRVLVEDAAVAQAVRHRVLSCLKLDSDR
ncbi:malate dehydrogenase (quinone) [Pseudomethylobacillus aquaticus]|nr:malate dehydrogenase (quinone) [Pseudomethylobacillus aquaticus]